jgi:cytoskeletal protein RodZ
MSTNDSSNNGTIKPLQANEPSPETIGKMLREAREAKGYSIKKISHHTKIATSILERLEGDRLVEMPSRTYVNGFVKSFAQVVDLDLAVCMQALERTYRQNSPNNVANDPINKAGVFEGKDIQNPHAQTSLLITLGIVSIMIVLGIFINRDSSKQAPKEIAVKTHELNETTPLKIPNPVNTNKENDVANSNTVPVAATNTTSTAVVNSLAANTMTITNDVQSVPHTLSNVASIAGPLSGQTDNILDKTGSTTLNLPQAPTTASIKAEEIKKVETKTEVKTELKPEAKLEVKPEEKKDPALSNIELKPLPRVIYTSVDEKLSKDSLKSFVPANMQSSVVEGKQNVFIAAVDENTWITYKKDDEEVKKFILEKGKNILIRGDEIRIFLGNVNATRIFLNNNLLNVASKSGVKSLVFPKENAPKFKLPLFIYKDSGTVVPSSDL